MTMKLIETKTLATAAGSIEFTSIPQTFTDLVILHSIRNSLSAINADVFLVCNNTNNVYDTRRLAGQGSSAFSDSQTNAVMRIAESPAATATANTFGNGTVYIPSYTSSVNKSLSTDSVMENNATFSVQLLTSNLIKITSPLTTLRLSTGASFVAGSTVSLYGITKGSDGIVTTS